MTRSQTNVRNQGNQTASARNDGRRMPTACCAPRLAPTAAAATTTTTTAAAATANTIGITIPSAIADDTTPSRSAHPPPNATHLPARPHACARRVPVLWPAGTRTRHGGRAVGGRAACAGVGRRRRGLCGVHTLCRAARTLVCGAREEWRTGVPVTMGLVFISAVCRARGTRGMRCVRVCASLCAPVPSAARAWAHASPRRSHCWCAILQFTATTHHGTISSMVAVTHTH